MCNIDFNLKYFSFELIQFSKLKYFQTMLHQTQYHIYFDWLMHLSKIHFWGDFYISDLFFKHQLFQFRARYANIIKFKRSESFKILDLEFFQVTYFLSKFLKCILFPFLKCHFLHLFSHNCHKFLFFNLASCFREKSKHKKKSWTNRFLC